MKSSFYKKLKWTGIILLILVAVVAGIGYYLIRQHPREWRYWRDLPRSVKWQIVELEAERLYHRISPPPPVPERYDHVTAETIERSMRLGADWLIAMQEPSGRFQYWYNPVKDKFSSKFNDNFLRQAGTSYSMTLIYEMTGDESYLDSARKSLDYLMEFSEQLDHDKAYFLFAQKAKLGGISLPMLTMLKVRDLTATIEYDDILKKLANMILFLQKKYGTGQYKSTYVYRGDYEYEKNKGWESRIYPGEALFALAGMYRAFGDPRYKKSMDWALDFYSKENRWKSHAFLPWTISAFVSLYKEVPEQRYADFVFMMGDHLITQQNLDSSDQVYGSFHGIPTANTGSYMEGLGDAIQLAQLTVDIERLNLSSARAKMGSRWLLMLQYTEADGESLKRPELAVGGFRTSLFDPQLRIDNTQHAISSFARGLRFVFERSPAVLSSSTAQT